MMMIRMQQCSVVAAGNRNDLQMSSLSQYLVLHVVMQDTSLMKKICSVVPCDSNSCVSKMNLGPQKKFKFYLLAVLHWAVANENFSGALNLAWFSEILMRMAKPHPGMENIGVSEMEEMLMKEFSQVNQSAVSIKETSSEIKFCEIMTNFRSQGHYSPAVWGSVSLVYNDFCRMENSLELTHCVHMFQYWPSAAVLWVWCGVSLHVLVSFGSCLKCHPSPWCSSPGELQCLWVCGWCPDSCISSHCLEGIFGLREGEVSGREWRLTSAVALCPAGLVSPGSVQPAGRSV